jgi:hypothetical protein
MAKENFYLQIRCERCQEGYVDDCIDCIKKQKDMGVEVRFSNQLSTKVESFLTLNYKEQ